MGNGIEGMLKQPHLLARTKEFDLLCYWAIAIALIIFEWLYLYRHSYAYHASTGWQLYSIWAANHLGAGQTDFLMSYRPGYMLNVLLVQWFHLSFYGLRMAMGLLLLLATLCFVVGIETLDWTRATLPLGLAYAGLHRTFYRLSHQLLYRRDIVSHVWFWSVDGF